MANGHGIQILEINIIVDKATHKVMKGTALQYCTCLHLHHHLHSKTQNDSLNSAIVLHAAWCVLYQCMAQEIHHHM